MTNQTQTLGQLHPLTTTMTMWGEGTPTRTWSPSQPQRSMLERLQHPQLTTKPMRQHQHLMSASHRMHQATTKMMSIPTQKPSQLQQPPSARTLQQQSPTQMMAAPTQTPSLTQQLTPWSPSAPHPTSNPIRPT